MFLKRGVLGRVGGVLCTYPERMCDGGVKKGSGGRILGKRRPHLGKKETPSGQIVRIVGKSALELGEKKFNNVDLQRVQQTSLRQRPAHFQGHARTPETSVKLKGQDQRNRQLSSLSLSTYILPVCPTPSEAALRARLQICFRCT